MYNPIYRSVMDIGDFFFRLAPALQFVFELSYVPQPEDFKEFTPAQYASFYRQGLDKEMDGDQKQRLFVFLPEDPKAYNRLVEMYGDQLMIVKESEISAFKSVEEFIANCCNDSGQTFDSLSEKLAYIARRIPDVFTEGTPYALCSKRPPK